MRAFRPSWAYRFNADIEDDAEREYAQFVAEHPEWDDRPFQFLTAAEYGTYDSLAGRRPRPGEFAVPDVVLGLQRHQEQSQQRGEHRPTASRPRRGESQDVRDRTPHHRPERPARP